MRFAFIVFAALVAATPLSARAAVPASLDLNPAPSRNVVEIAAYCGHGAHYVRGHRARNGHYVRGRCVSNHHHHR